MNTSKWWCGPRPPANNDVGNEHQQMMICYMNIMNIIVLYNDDLVHEHYCISNHDIILVVTNDIMCAVDQKKAVVLVLLYLSAAFDTTDHSILLNRLHKRYGITGTALSWFETYLTDHCQVIQLNGESSDEMRLQFGVPQGSVLGPLLFTSYTAPLGEIARRHSVELHLYADDTQVYMSFSPLSDESTTRTFQRIEACIAEIRTWLKDNKLLLNDDKTDVLVISSVSMRSKLQVPHLKIGSSLVTPSPMVRNIGLYMNSVMDMEQ